ncbi:outer membrane beta-barrel protein [Nonlabens ponticola]|uniref:Outer membrane protein beta-barrel domain-containing protein n=1 Tax=Nonlabens ponticola TaxID=2496866 RepID=A0A3S9MVR2_9FLAO|nr:outer membrane beta-barrel protein [Nonlabens ponticola]AZQ43219.1 hypothetical protein EJ995_02825 [Nonlabens ponticola]
MEDKKDIERIFQERFKQFEAAPPQDTWSQIEARLNGKKKRRVIPIIWWQLGGVAAVLAVVVASYMMGSDEFDAVDGNNGYVIEETNNSDSSQENNRGLLNDNDFEPSTTNPASTGNTNIVSTDNENTVSSDSNVNDVSSPRPADALAAGIQDKGDVSSATSGNIATPSGDDDQTVGIASTAIENDNTLRIPNTNAGIANNDTNLDNKTQGSTPKVLDLDGLKVSDGVATTDPAQNVPDGADKDMVPSNEESLQEIADAVVTAGTKITIEEERQDRLLNNRWSAATVVAPVFANSFNGSSINNNVGDASGDTNISYGVAVDYNISSRLSVRTGVHQMNVAYNTNNVSYSTPISAIAVAGSAPGRSYNPGDVNRANAIPIDNTFSQELVSNNNFGGFQGELSQQLGYVEVPLELKYRLVDSKLGINVLGGFSALFLTDNEVNISGNGRRLELGEDRNFQDFNQSANFGLGLDYQFTNKLGLSIEPTFKYQLNALRNDAADFRPYTIGVYTGLMYRF